MFTTLQSVRTKAGLQKKVQTQTLYEVTRRTPDQGDGSTVDFYTEKSPIVDTNRDDTADVNDVQVYVAGTLMTPTTQYTLDVDQGKVTFVSAPANGANLSITYAWSPADDEDVQEAISAAWGTIEKNLGKVYTLPIDDASVNADFANSSAEDELTSIETYLAAAELLDNRQGEDNPENGTKADSLRTIAMDKLKSILSMETELFDSEGQPLSKSSRILMAGYPMQSDVDSGDIEAFVTRDTQF